jgi:hypothetical protein
VSFAEDEDSADEKLLLPLDLLPPPPLDLASTTAAPTNNITIRSTANAKIAFLFITYHNH